MCGRFARRRPKAELAVLFGCAEPPVEVGLSHNISPLQQALVLRFNPSDGQRHLTALRWGLVPGWSAEASSAGKLANARADSLAHKPSFREAYAKRRCLVPVDAFYEWQRTAKSKQPFAFASADGGTLALAGLWESWRAPDGSILRSFALITTEANTLMAPIHHRMPVVVEPAYWARWLGQEAGDVASLLKPCPPEGLTCWPVSTRVNSGREDDAAVLAPITLTPQLELT